MATPKGSGDFASAVDEKLRRRTEHSILQGENSDRAADDRQLDWQFPDERVFGGERKYGLRMDRQIASGSEKIDDHLQTMRDHRRAGTREPLCVKDVPDKPSEPTARWRQNPQFANQLG